MRLFVPANPNNWACGAAEQFHHGRLLDAGVQLLGYPKMLHAKAFIADGKHVLVGTCNLEAWSLKRFFEIDLGFDSTDLAAQFDERFLAPAEEVSSDLQPPSGLKERARAAAFAAISPLLEAPGRRRSPDAGVTETLRVGDPRIGAVGDRKLLLAGRIEASKTILDGFAALRRNSLLEVLEQVAESAHDLD